MIRTCRSLFSRKKLTDRKTFQLIPQSFNDAEELVTIGPTQSLLKLNVGMGNQIQSCYRELTDVSDAELDNENQNIRIRSYNFSNCTDAYLDTALLDYNARSIHPKAKTILLFEILLRSGYSLYSSKIRHDEYTMFNHVVNYPLFIDYDETKRITSTLANCLGASKVLKSADFYMFNYYFQFAVIIHGFSLHAEVKDKLLNSFESTLAAASHDEVPKVDAVSLFNGIQWMTEVFMRFDELNEREKENLRQIITEHIELLFTWSDKARPHTVISFFLLCKHLDLMNADFRELVGDYFYNNDLFSFQEDINSAMHALIYAIELYIDHPNFPELPGLTKISQKISNLLNNLFSQLDDEETEVLLEGNFLALYKSFTLTSLSY